MKDTKLKFEPIMSFAFVYEKSFGFELYQSIHYMAPPYCKQIVCCSMNHSQKSILCASNHHHSVHINITLWYLCYECYLYIIHYLHYMFFIYDTQLLRTYYDYS